MKHVSFFSVVFDALLSPYSTANIVGWRRTQDTYLTRYLFDDSCRNTCRYAAKYQASIQPYGAGNIKVCFLYFNANDSPIDQHHRRWSNESTSKPLWRRLTMTPSRPTKSNACSHVWRTRQKPRLLESRDYHHHSLASRSWRLASSAWQQS